MKLPVPRFHSADKFLGASEHDECRADPLDKLAGSRLECSQPQACSFAEQKSRWDATVECRS
jgi:hypothetical protein